jgi:cytochrome P450
MTTDYDSVDIFTDDSVVADPYPYFEHLRSKCPITSLSREGVVGVTGYDEAVAIFRDPETFSSVNSGAGPLLPVVEPPNGDDATNIIDSQRSMLVGFQGGEHMVSMDPPEHTAERAVLTRLLTPKRLRENEEFMWRYADSYLDELVGTSACEFVGEFSRPFTYFVVADLLGVPAEYHEEFRARLALGSKLGGNTDGEATGEAAQAMMVTGFSYLEELFASFLDDRRREPKQDVLTSIALAKYPDGSTPPLDKIMRTATFLFLAGTETSARLLATCLFFLAEDQVLQERLRNDRDLVNNFIEECLRIESPVKTDSRMVRRATTVAGVDLPAGTCVSIFPGAANRDPRRFDAPNEFRVDRPNAMTHLSFGRGDHSCPGAPLARTEARVTVNRVLDRMSDISLSEEHHGPPGSRHFEYTPTFVLRGIEKLHLTYTAVTQ